MSKKTSKRKVVVKSDTTTKKVTPTVSRTRNTGGVSSIGTGEKLIFNKQNYILMGIGFALVLVGLLLMAGGGMPDPDTWDPNIIYSFRRTTLAPMVILAGLIVEIYAIFKR